MDFTQIASADLGSVHLDRVLRISWPQQIGTTVSRATMQGRLVHVAHSSSGTSLALDLEAIEVSVDSFGLKAGTIEIAD